MYLPKCLQLLSENTLEKKNKTSIKDIIKVICY